MQWASSMTSRSTCAEANSVESVAAAYNERRQRNQTKLEQMVVYTQTARCRTAALLDALGETSVERCDRCDNCRGTAYSCPGGRAWRRLRVMSGKER